MPYANPFASTAAPIKSGGALPSAGGYKNPFGTTQAPKTAPPSPASGGSGYGASTQTDPYSSKPLATVPVTIPKTFASPETIISQIDPNRVATSFDPTVAQKLTPEMLQNGRMPETASQKVKDSLGGNSSEELDHQIALELSGSNNSSNLKLEPNVPGTHNTATDPLENALAKQVVGGKLSLIDAQRQLAKAKGITLKEDSAKNSTLNDYLLNTPSVLKPLAGAQDAITGAASKVGGFFHDLFTNPTKTMQETDAKVFHAFGGNVVADPVGAFKNIKATGEKQATESIQNLASSAEQVASDFKTNQPAVSKAASIINLLTASASTLFLPISETFSLAQQLPIIKPAADIAGVIFDDAGKVTGFAADKLLNTLPISQSIKDKLQAPIVAAATLGGQITLGAYIYGKVTNALDVNGKLADIKANSIADEAAQKATEMKPVETAPQTTELKVNDLPTSERDTAITAMVKAGIPKEEATQQLTTPGLYDYIKNGGDAGNIEVTKQADGSYEITDGLNRLSVARGLGQETIKANVTSPTRVTDVQKTGQPVNLKTQPAETGPKVTDIVAPKKAEITVPKETPQVKASEVVQPKKAVVKLPEKIETPPERLPQVADENGMKKSGVARSVEAKALEKGIIEHPIDDMAKYNSRQVKDQIAKVQDMMDTDPIQANNIAMGKLKAPADISPMMVFRAIENRAMESGDAATLKELSKSKILSDVSQGASELRMAGEREQSSAVQKMQELQRARDAYVEKKTGKPKAKAESEIVKQAKDILSKEKVARPKISWNDFVESIKC